MTILHSLIFGLVEGITEFLPISSTAHLIITSKLLGLPESTTLSSFLIAIQLGAILSVAVLYTKTILKNPKLILKIAAAFIPTAIIGLLAYKLVKDYLLESLLTIAIALLLGGIILIVLEKYFARRKAKISETEESLEQLSYSQAAIIGVCQALAVVPGVSRSAATIMGGLALKISRKNIVEFSFLLALPTMLAATALDLYKSPPNLNGSELIIWSIGLIVAFITATLGIRFFLRYIKKHDFQIFGWYRIILGLIIILYLFI
ncbi:MAG: undecaprenyl-diphosphatase UppP [Patescibacteria group bacterium]|nr:undecaprenyl-diphosphatase UppP [Patescibacteria group bacterium]